jgi:hypothetical protein
MTFKNDILRLLKEELALRKLKREKINFNSEDKRNNWNLRNIK